jgi:nucleotide-binding universal stress UspA family protein
LIEPVFASIVVGTDGSSTAQTALRAAIDLARDNGARLSIVSAYEAVSSQASPAAEALSGPVAAGVTDVPTGAGPAPDPAGTLGPAATREEEWAVGPRPEVVRLLSEARQMAIDAGVAPLETFARQGDAADAIIDVAEEQAADLIVVGNKGLTGAKRFLLGSVPKKVSHHAPCSVLIVRTT